MSKYPTETELIRTKAMVLINQKATEEAASLMKNFTPSFDEHLGYYNTLAFAEMSLGHLKNPFDFIDNWWTKDRKNPAIGFRWPWPTSAVTI